MIFRHLSGFLRKHDRISKGALERLSSTNLHEINPRRSGPAHAVLTLDPRKFVEKEQRRFHIGGQQSFRPCIALHNQSSPVAGPTIYYHSTRQKLPYPPDTTAFLYYFTSPEKPRIAGELRLRVASNDDFASFGSGSDLLHTNGQLWSRSLFKVSKFYISLYEKLREDGLVPDDLDAVLSTFPPTMRKCQHLYTLNDTFIVDFSSEDVYFMVITEHGMEKIGLYNVYLEQRPTRRSPYTGSALARFERSTLPDHNGTRTVVLRFLKIITSVKCVIPFYDGYIRQPKEGELLRRSSTRKSTRKILTAIDKLNQPVWSVDIDKSVSLRGLQLLWDT